MATASFSADLTPHHHRRDSASSNKSLSGRRPRLLRAYATEPSITTENACRGLLTTPTYSSRRAAELLNRVVVSNSNSTSPTSTSSRNSVLESGRVTETSHESYSACYFSFPSFDTWDEERRRDDEKALERP
ncbi:putative related to heterogeneous nuclear ribonucleoprotein G [Rosellinia necatrix]|uniref:Putative related to heterogeneous nuclear ribonucleoprotein G n=1 Tax=Rosellinia necatrix TaxID=77044 RepID=A0A1W2THP8_ROSNE|nr:putative related to heterogeneous nuclear ribonucleoprotein G [Rosellinia necatrix]